MNRYFILSFCIFFLFVSRQVSASSGVTYCENDLATKCQDSCSFKVSLRLLRDLFILCSSSEMRNGILPLVYQLR